MKQTESPCSEASSHNDPSSGRRVVPDSAFGWAVTARFGAGGTRWTGSGPHLRVVAVNPRRGTGASVDARLDLLQRAIDATHTDGPCVYLTSAGYFGCVTTAGDSTRDFSWPGDLDLGDLDRRLGAISATLPKDTLLAVGAEQSWETHEQKVWWYTAGSRARSGEVVRDATALADRVLDVGGFRLLLFVCGEFWDGGSGFDMTRDTKRIDVVLDAAHGSINRVWDRAAEPWPRCAFQRTFLYLGRVCGGMLAQAHEADTGGGYARRQNNWVVYRGELPFPETEVIDV